VIRLAVLITAVALSSLGFVGAATPARQTCGAPSSAAPPTLALPDVVSGRIGFYAAVFQGSTVTREVALGDVSALFPTASMYKTLVVHAAMRAVDAGRLKLGTKLATSPANQSIERFPAGANSVLTLAQRSIQNSDNTASDILHLTVSPRALALEVSARNPCTTVLLTSKAWWAAQAGLLSEVLGTDTATGAQRYASLPFQQRLEVAAQLVQAARGVNVKALEAALDAYFNGATYTPDLELWIQNTTTPQAFTQLLAALMPATDLSPATRTTFRQIMTTGCCIPRPSSLRPTYRAAKAGSGWRVLTLSGYMEFPGGVRVAYTYMNQHSDTRDAEDMERQIRPVNAWIEAVLRPLIGQ
jgi:beta-lactamase class A